jgi:hypothetical protein
MKKRLQVILSDDAQAALESLMKEANEGFQAGSISYSDAVNEMILASKVDIRALQLKHTDLRRSLRAMASEPNVDIEGVIKNLMELKSKTGKRPTKAQQTELL